MPTTPTRIHPLWSLTDNELDLVLRLVLASGSLKELAQSYGVSYPTIRSRLDAVIRHLNEILEGRSQEEMPELLSGLIASGEITPAAAQTILETYRRERNAETLPASRNEVAQRYG